MSFDKENVLEELKDSVSQDEKTSEGLSDAPTQESDKAGQNADDNEAAERVKGLEGESLSDKVVDFTPKLDKLGRAYATGRRKESVACVWIKPGKGETKINGKSLKDYFYDLGHRRLVNEVFSVVDAVDKFDIMVKVSGGGLSGQAGAIAHGLSRALLNFDPLNMKASLKKAGFLTRDAREVERKKPGLPKARKKKQFSKR